MTIKERLLNAIKGNSVDELPFLPRLDIWYNANKFRGTLPKKYKNASLKEMTEDLGLGYHYIIPDYKAWDGADRDIDIGLGHYRFNTKPFRLVFHNMKREVVEDGKGNYHIKYITPVGEVTTCYHYDYRMKETGLTLNVITEHAIKGENDNDYDTIAYIFENCEVVPDYSGYHQFMDEVVGDNGLCVGYVAAWASPMHYIVQDLMDFESFCYERVENEGKINELCDRLTPFFHEIFDAVLNSRAELMLCGCNFDRSITPPNLFAESITPFIKQQADKAHRAGKYIITHPDGENSGLLEEYVKSGMDVADSICPAPMTNCTLKEVRDVFKNKITIWGGIPSICFLEESMSEYEFEKYMDMTLESVGSGRRIILGIADTTPPDAKFDRVLKAAEMIKKFGPVK